MRDERREKGSSRVNSVTTVFSGKGADFTKVVSVIGECKGCDIVQSDHAPQAGVAQGIFDGELVKRRVGHQVELEEEQDKEVEGRVKRDAQRTTHKCACMDDME